MSLEQEVTGLLKVIDQRTKQAIYAQVIASGFVIVVLLFTTYLTIKHGDQPINEHYQGPS